MEESHHHNALLHPRSILRGKEDGLGVSICILSYILISHLAITITITTCVCRFLHEIISIFSSTLQHRVKVSLLFSMIAICLLLYFIDNRLQPVSCQDQNQFTINVYPV